MYRWLPLAALAVLILAAPAPAANLTGRYVEARTCDIWTGPCFANAEMNLTGKHAVAHRAHQLGLRFGEVELHDVTAEIKRLADAGPLTPEQLDHLLRDRLTA